jgi:transposase-like protein
MPRRRASKGMLKLSLKLYTLHMKVIHYKSDDPWIGTLKCPACDNLTPAWQSSGTSESFPHFYCDTCSNVIHREEDKALVYSAEPSQELLEFIAQSLPACPCGGQFKPNTDPKCVSCNSKFTHQNSAVQRLTLPNLILIDGACLIRDSLFSYQISIGSKLKFWLRVLKNSIQY